MKRRAFVVLLAMSSTGCAELLPALVKMATGSNFLGSLIDVAAGGARAYFDRHPNQDRQESVDAAVRHARQTRAAFNAVVATVQAASKNDTGLTKAEAVKAYAELRTLLEGMGILSATAPEGGAETDAPEPVPFELPDPSVVEAAL